MNFPKTTARQTRLSSELTCLTHLDPTHPVINLQIWVESGSMHEGHQPGSGLSHLLEHMVFKGTRSYPGEELTRRVEQKGGSWNAYTTYDRTVYYIDGPAEFGKEFLELLFELVYLPLLPEGEFEQEREVIRREIAMGKDDPHSVAWESHLALIYQSDLRQYPIIGLQDRFDKVTHAEMVAYHEAHYTFDNSFVVLSGDFEEAQLLEELERLCQSVPPRRKAVLPLPQERPGGAPLHAVREFAVPHYKLLLTWEIPSSAHRDSFALELLASLLGGARSSPLYQTFREHRQRVESITTWCWNPKHAPGFFALSVECEPKQYEGLIDELVEYLKNCDLSERVEDLKRAKKQAYLSQIGTLTTAAGRAGDLASNWFEARSLDLTRYYLQRLDAVKLQDVQEVLETYLKEGVLRSSVVAPLDSLSDYRPCSGDLKVLPEQRRLASGMPLILGRDLRLPTISFKLIYKGGACLETSEKEGIGALYATMLMKGTRSQSAEEFVTALDQQGVSLSFSGGNNTFMASGYCLKEDLGRLLELLVEVLQEPLFDQQHLEKERGILLSKVKESALDPLKLAFWHTKRVLLEGSPYRLSRLGSEETLRVLSSTDLHAYHRALILEGEAVFSVFGNLGEEEMAHIKQTIGTLPYQSRRLDLPIPNYGRGYYELPLDKEQAVLVLAYPGETLEGENQAEWEVIEEYLSGMTGPLFSQIREERGLSYYVSCTQFFGHKAGFFAIYLGTSPEQKEEALQAVQQVIADITAEGISESDLQLVKQSLRASEALENQSNSRLAQSYGVDVLLGKGLDHRRAMQARISELTCQEVSDCLKKGFHEVQPVITVVTP